jgi:hypothetical protein
VAAVHHGGEKRVAGAHDGPRLLAYEMAAEAGSLGGEIAGLALRRTRMIMHLLLPRVLV